MESPEILDGCAADTALTHPGDPTEGVPMTHLVHSAPFWFVYNIFSSRKENMCVDWLPCVFCASVLCRGSSSWLLKRFGRHPRVSRNTPRLTLRACASTGAHLHGECGRREGAVQADRQPGDSHRRARALEPQTGQAASPGQHEEHRERRDSQVRVGSRLTSRPQGVL